MSRLADCAVLLSACTSLLLYTGCRKICEKYLYRYLTDSRRRKKFAYGNMVIFQIVTLLSCAATVRNRYPVSMNQSTNPFLCFIRGTVFLLYKTDEPKQTTYFVTPCIFCPPLLRFVCSSASRSLSRCLMFVR